MSDAAPAQPEAEDPRWVVHSYRVIFGDTDAMGVMYYYGNYLRLIEIGRAEYLRARGGCYRDMEESGFGLPVTEVGVRYRAPARYDDLLRVAARLEWMRRATLRFAYRVTREPDGALLAEAFSEHACLDKRTGRPARIPAAVAALLPGGG